MRAIGRAANFIVDVVMTVFSFIFRLIAFIFFFWAMYYTVPTFWSTIDPAHLTSLSSIVSIAVLVLMGLMIFAAVGLLDHFDLRSTVPKSGGGEMRTANRDDLRAGGILGKR
jgi:hypothetical protein